MSTPIGERSISRKNLSIDHKRILIALIAGTICASILSESKAATVTGTFAVSATVVAACTSISATPMAFGTISPTGTATSTSTVTLNCSTGTAYSISAVGAFSACAGEISYVNIMTSPSSPNYNSPVYELFKDAAHQLPLANGQNTSCGTPMTALTGTTSSSAQTVTLYGLLMGTFQGQTPTVSGNYTDTATVTLTF